MRHQVFIALGSNLGDRAENLRRAVMLLGGMLHVEAVSDWFETKPVGGPAGQGAYLNGALHATTTGSARTILQFCLEVELQLGRDRSATAQRWGARTLDLDLLFFDDAVIYEPPGLIVPHPRLSERRFVLEPLCQIAPHWQHPELGRSVSELLHALPPIAGDQ